MQFSQQEIKDIAISAAVLAFAFGGIDNFLTALFVVGVAFISHEVIGHKFVAQKLGAFAEYKAWNLGLLLALVSSFFGFVFAAPGAVYFSERYKGPFAFTVHKLGKKEVGMIGLGGPLVNIVLGALFIAAALFALPAYYSLLLFAARISFFLAMFNLLPIPPLDGEKVMSWDIKIWVAAIALAGAGYVGIGML